MSEDLSQTKSLRGAMRGRAFVLVLVALLVLAGAAAAGYYWRQYAFFAPGPAQFDGAYELDRLPLGRTYSVYAEPLNGAVSPSQITPAIATLCRNSSTDPGWPPLQSCTVPAANTTFTTRTR